VTAALWRATWEGLHERGGGEREAACVWAGSREGAVEAAQEIVFLDDLPGTVGRRLQHRTSREAVAEMLARTRQLGLDIVADIHTHPESWVGLSPVDQEHPIEYRIGLLALVLPNFGAGVPDLRLAGVHEYLGGGRWQTFALEAALRRVRIQKGRHP
jgi:proteasome lid subunit RPN8/RPN11